MAEACNARVLPHNCASSLSAAASLQARAACANAMPLEIYPHLPESHGYVQVMDDAPEDRIRNGRLEVSKAPGLGATVNAARLKRCCKFDFRAENG